MWLLEEDSLAAVKEVRLTLNTSNIHFRALKRNLYFGTKSNKKIRKIAILRIAKRKMTMMKKISMKSLL